MARARSIQHVYFDDLDALNILHNVRYLLFTERARHELFNALGFHWQDDVSKNPDKIHVIAEHSIRYLAPFHGEGEVCVSTEIAHFGRTSLTFAARVEAEAGDVVFAEASTRLVRLDVATRRPCPWSDRFRAAIDGWMRAKDM